MAVPLVILRSDIFMEEKLCILAIFLLCICFGRVHAQAWSFEGGIPSRLSASCDKELAISEAYYKDGKKSLEWQFHSNSILTISNSNLLLDKDKADKYGITLWIYNEQPQKDSLQFQFLSPKGHISYQFSFKLSAAGWRACWIGFKHMLGDKKEQEIVQWRIIAPNREGRVFIDRLTFPVKKMNLRTTPDQQMPYNNSLTFRDLWHWCRVWQWEQYQYDLPLPIALTKNERDELHNVETRLDHVLALSMPSKESINDAYETFRKANIKRSLSGFTGAPIVAPDELDRSKGEMSWNDIETMLSGFAYDAYYNNSQDAENKYFLVWDFAIDQGFAYGSGMGTNHHYGYQVRKIYSAAWLMRDKIWKSPNCDNIISTLLFWSALQETRKACTQERDELLDSWHTLLMPKTIAALMQTDERERSRALKGLTRWLSSSLHYTPGTIGGIKIDGTTFHHGGFYPAYTTGVLASIGTYISLTNGTQYEPTKEARQVLKSAFIAMRNYCNKYEWGIGLSGRHPFSGSMKDDDIASFAYLALAGDLSGQGDAFDHQLAADYLRLFTGESKEKEFFKSQGIKAAKAPEGFFVYNYGAAGIFRRNNWMVTLKGYNTDVWGAEIYAKDNRYGRYQSYGSVQIMGQESRKASGYNEEGWDWNRLPGTTSIHLPFELLDSPLPATTMAKSREHFSGACSLEGKNGIFTTKLMERDLKNFTSDFVARKTVFCFENRMICLGTGISNTNSIYPTETTLFQSVWEKDGEGVRINGQQKNQLGFHQNMHATEEHPVCLQDGYRNQYYIKKGDVHVQIAHQESRHEKNREFTYGDFSSAWINHGYAPQNGTYEYLVWIQPTAQEQKEIHPLDTYQVIQANNNAHIVYDVITGIKAYSVFEDLQLKDDLLFLEIPAETMVMHKFSDEKLLVSICDPNLNIQEKAYTTKSPSRPISKRLILCHQWELVSESPNVHVEHVGNQTLLDVICQHGIPVEFSFQKK